MALQLRHLVQLLCFCFWDWTWLSHYETHCSKRFLLRKFVDRKKTRCSYMARWFEQAVKTPSSINTILVLTIVSYSLQHFSSSKGSNKAHSIDFERLLQSKHPCLLCLLSVLNWKLTNYDVTKSSSDNFPTFPRTVPFVWRRKRAIFNVEYLGDVLMKSCKILDYDYLDCNLLFSVKIKPGPISLHLTFKLV